MASAPHDNHSDYVRGEMDVAEQASTYSLFMALSKWGSLVIAALLAGLTIWFQPNGSMIGGFITTFVLLVVGFFALKSKKKAH